MLLKPIKKKNKYGNRKTILGILEEKEVAECFKCHKKLLKGDYLFYNKSPQNTSSPNDKIFCLECAEDLNVSGVKVFFIGSKEELLKNEVNKK